MVIQAGEIASREQNFGFDNSKTQVKKYLTKLNGKLPEQPTRDEIFRRQNSLDLYTNAKILEEGSTTSNFAFKFGVSFLSFFEYKF